MGSFLTLSALALLSLHAQPISAYWRMACSISQTSRIDPILSPGTPSGHVHKFAGGNYVNQNSTHDSLLNSTCSTCEVQSDKSAYWTPQLYYEHADGTIEEVQNDGMTVYYVGRGGDSSNTVPFPFGFKMISGNALSRHYDEQSLTYLDTRPVADRVSFRCINAANNIPETHYLDRTDCVNGLRAQINFQSCWDGVNLYKPDNSHVAYLSGIDYGVCPPSHPVPIPGLFFEVLYWTNRINQRGGGRFVFSNGDATGYGFHGDFLNGWEQEVQNRAVEQCLYTDNDGTVSACPPLAVNSAGDFARICPESPSVLSEASKGVLPNKRLPGCNPITTGPEDARPPPCPANDTSTTSSPSPPISISTARYTNSSSTRTALPTSINTTIPITFVNSTRTSMSVTITASVKTFGPSLVPIGTLNVTRPTPGGVFATVSNNSTLSSSTEPQTTMATVTATTTVTITNIASIAGASTFQSLFFPVPRNSTFAFGTGNSTTSTVMANGTASEPLTTTTFTTVFAPITVNVTTVTDVTTTVSPAVNEKRDGEWVTVRVRGRVVVRKNAQMKGVN